jgi:hypothetical protein
MRTFKSFLEESADAGLKAKADKSGVSLSVLKKVYSRGVAAWNSGHRPGTTPQQWGMARVNSYITKGKGTYYGADQDLHEEELNEEVPKDKESGLPKVYVAGLSPSTAKARAAHWNKMDKKSDSDPTAYEPAPGDATAKTKTSKHTLKYRQMYGEEHTNCGTPNCCGQCNEELIIEESEYEGRKVKLNDPFRLPTGSKSKFGVYVKNDKGNTVKVTFGDPNMEIKRDDPGRRASFRARHGCDNPGPKWKAKYWSCMQWRAGAKVDD